MAFMFLPETINRWNEEIFIFWLAENRQNQYPRRLCDAVDKLIRVLWRKRPYLYVYMPVRLPSMTECLHGWRVVVA